MSKAAPRLATYSDLLALPESVRGEIVAGELRTAPSALPKHSRAMRALGGAIGKPFDDDDGRGGPGGWWIFLEVDVQLSEHDIVRPDLAGWRRERLAEPWDTRPIALVPDWVCEILSPSNAAHDRVIKAKLYADHGVAHYWILDPAERTLEVFQLTGELWTRLASYDDSAVARIQPFDAIELVVGTLFPPKR